MARVEAVVSAEEIWVMVVASEVMAEVEMAKAIVGVGVKVGESEATAVVNMVMVGARLEEG